MDILIPNLTGVSAPTTKRTSPTVSDFNAMRQDVKPKLSSSPLLDIVGEAPSIVEMAQGEPFVGPAGKQLRRALNGANVPMHQVNLYNACQTQLPRNDAKHLFKTNNKGEVTWKHPQWEELRARLISQLAESPAKVVMPMGGTALLALSGDLNTQKISLYRGSCYHAKDIGLGMLGDKYILPSFHPSMMEPRKAPKSYFIVLRDIVKALHVAKNGLPKMDIKVTIARSVEQAIEWLRGIQPGMETAFDIECSQLGLQCLGFSKDEGRDVMTIPFWGPNGNVWTEREELMIMQEIARILEHPEIRLLMQNGMFDTYWMYRNMGVKLDNFYFDTMLGHHYCYVDLPKGLDFLTSYYTFFPYYKNEGKMWKSLGMDYEMFYEYNAKDVAYTHMIYLQILKELDHLNSREHFFESVMPLHQPLLEMMSHGLKVDISGRANAKDEVNKRIDELMTQVADIVEERTGNRREINVRSPKAKGYFYTELGIKPYVNKKTKAPRLDQDALKRIARKGYEEAKLLGEISTRRTERDTFYNASTDADGYMRCTYNIAGTSSGRLSSSANIYGHGLNLQNQPGYMKRFYIAEDGWLFIDSDYAQAESWVVAFDSQDANMIDTMTRGVDVHTLNASKIFNIPYEEVTKQLRKDGKRTGHAANYMMGYVTFAMQNDLPQNIAKQRLDQYVYTYGRLPVWWDSIKREVTQTRMLRNLFGRPRRFLGYLDDATFREAVSFKPQSTVGELMNRSCIKLAKNRCGLDYQIRTTVHDSVMVAIKPRGVDDVVNMMQHMTNMMTHEFTIHGRSFIIPNDFKLGNAWGTMYDKDNNPCPSRMTAEVKTINRDEIAAHMEVMGYAV